MLSCINKNSAEYQTLKKRSGISDFILESICRDFLDKYNRLPYLDEIQGSNSEPILKQELKIDNYNSTSIDRILSTTGQETIEEANATLNNEYRDLEIEITPLNKEAIVDITKRPTSDNFDNQTEENKILSKAYRNTNGQLLAPNGYLVLTNALQKLASLYGIKFNEITDSELNSDKWNGIIPDPSSVNAFVYNGQIYINVDKADLDAPIHEMMHIFVGSIRFQNPNLYLNLINLAEQFPNYTKLIQQFPGRTRNDVNEEVFIQEVAKYLIGQPSNITNLDNKIQYEISYNVKRLLDTILMGQDSVKTLSDDRLFTLSLKDIAQEINSSIMSNNFHGTVNVENSELHRKLNNIKSDLYSQKILEEYCD